MELHKTTRKAVIKFGGKRYERRIYEFIDPVAKWWRDAVKLGSMGSDPQAYVPLDTFDDYKVIELAVW